MDGRCIFMFKQIWPFFVMCLMLMNTCGAQNLQEKSDDQYFVMIDKTKVFAKDLIITDGVDDGHSGYFKMNGYPGEDRFQIYFQDNSHDNITSMHVIYDDLRGLDLNEYFYFTYEGIEYRMPRGKVNNAFLNYAGSDFELFLRATFPGAYNDWIESNAFSNEAERLVKSYIDYKHKLKPVKSWDNTIKLDSGGLQ